MVLFDTMKFHYFFLFILFRRCGSILLQDLEFLKTAVSINTTQKTLFYVGSSTSFQNINIQKTCLTTFNRKSLFGCCDPKESSFIRIDMYIDGIIDAKIDVYDMNDRVIYTDTLTFYSKSVSYEADIPILIQPDYHFYSSIHETPSLYFTLFYDNHSRSTSTEFTMELIGMAQFSLSSSATEIFVQDIEPGSYFFVITPMKYLFSGDQNSHFDILKGYVTTTYSGKFFPF